ncbi:MAG: flap endonuclease-1 [Candidatus Pacearchaeota archaeon]|nr:MAG: flap endonuclease-1 [Candidatus Pacearchaeota archaeon]
MGLQISDLVPKKEIGFEELRGKIIAVDAFNILYQFLANIRQVDGTPLMDKKKRVTSHLSGLFYRTTNLMTKGLKLVYVFDGESPELKAKTAKARHERKEAAKEKYEKAKEKGKAEEMFKWSRQTLRLSDEMIDESKQLLKALGLPVIQAPGEGEAQCAFMVKQKDAYAVASQDYDSLLFGATRLIQNLTLARRRRTPTGFISISPTLIELDNTLNNLQINRDQLISLGILVGTDFNPQGIKGIGPKKALHLVKAHRQPVLIFTSLDKLFKEGKIPELDFDWRKIFEIFKKPNVRKDYKIEFKKVNEKKIKELLCKEHDFSEDRVNNALNKVAEYEKSAKQKDLKSYF